MADPFKPPLRPRATTQPMSLPYTAPNPDEVTPQPTIGKETNYLARMVRDAMVAELAALEARATIRTQIEVSAEQSHDLESTRIERDNAKKRARGMRTLAITLGTALGFAMLVFSTAWGVYRDSRASAMNTAEDAKATATVATTVANVGDARIATHDVQIADINVAIGDLNKKLDMLIAALPQTTAVVVEPSKYQKTPKGPKKPPR